MKKKHDIKEILGYILKIAVVVAILEYVVLAKSGYMFGIHLFSPSPEKYVRQSITYIDGQAIDASNKAWTEYKENMLKQAKKMRKIPLCYDMLEEGIKIAGGKFSEFIRPEDVIEKEYEAPVIDFKTDGVVYIKLPEFGGNEEDQKSYAKTVTSQLKQYSSDIKAVILDIRGTKGFKLAPLIGAVTPLLPDGELMYYNVSGNNIPVSLNDGYVSGSGIDLKLEDSFKLSDVPVAILQDETTKQTGEAVRICFMGNKQAMTFGRPTAGNCFCDSRIKLYDKAVLHIVAGKYAAGDGVSIFYDNPISPDFETDAPYEAALEWIESL